MMKAAFLAFDACALWQVALLQMVLRRQGCVWRVLTPSGSPVQTDGGIRLVADGSLSEVTPRAFDLVVMAGGDYPPEVIESPQVHRFLRQFDGGQGLIAASCASILAVGAAGLLGGRRFTCLPHTEESGKDYLQYGIYTGDEVCLDENIVSCQGHAHSEWTAAVCEALGLFGADPHLQNVIVRLSGRRA